MKTGRTRRVRYAVVGLGHIAQNAVLPAFAHARKNSRLSALVSGDPKKRRVLSKRYGVARTYDYSQYAECLADPEVDAVYVALPNAMHREFAVAAAGAGKHVLCEKPLAVTVRTCEEIVRAAEQAGTRLMTGYRLHFDRANLKAAEIARSGKLGEPRLFQSSFAMQVQEGNIRLRAPEEGGGPIFDIGVYCINASRYLFRSEPTEVFAWSASSSDPRFRLAPEATSALLRFPGERLASFTCSFGAADTGWYQILGTKGRLRLDPAYSYTAPLELSVTIDGRTRRTRYARRDQFAAEIVYFSDCIRSDREPEPSGREGLADIRIVEAVRESAESARPVRLGEFVRRKRPTLAQEIRRPPTAQPSLVRVEAPKA